MVKPSRCGSRFESGGQQCCQPLLNGTMQAAPIFAKSTGLKLLSIFNVSREQLRAKSLASLGCTLHTRRALVALRRSRPLDAKVNHNIVMLTNMPFSKPVVTGFDVLWWSSFRVFRSRRGEWRCGNSETCHFLSLYPSSDTLAIIEIIVTVCFPQLIHFQIMFLDESLDFTDFDIRQYSLFLNYCTTITFNKKLSRAALRLNIRIESPAFVNA